MKNILVIYHADCPDGFGAAYAAWLVYGDNAEYLPCNHGGEVPDVTGREVFILDFSFDAEVLERMSQTAQSVTLLDHHKTAHDKLQCLNCGPGFKMLFDMQRSGARIAWEYFHPGKPAPRLITRIEDRDIWKWQYPDTRPFLAALDVLGFDFAKWARFHAESEDPARLPEILARGEAVVERFEQQVQSIVDSAFPIQFMGHSVWAVNATSDFTSDVGNKLAQKSGTFGVVFKVDSPSVVKVGLRAQRSFDASALAVQFGGGGHPQACAFRLPIEKLPALLNGTLVP